MYQRLLVTLALSSAAFLTSCQKDEIENDVRPAQHVQDSWTWARSSGGFTGQVLTPLSTGDQQQLEFGADGRVHRYLNGRIVSTDSYRAEPGKSALTGETAVIIRYGSGLRQSATVAGDYLTLRDEVADGQVHEYRR